MSCRARRGDEVGNKDIFCIYHYINDFISDELCVSYVCLMSARESDE